MMLALFSLPQLEYRDAPLLLEKKGALHPTPDGRHASTQPSTLREPRWGMPASLTIATTAPSHAPFDATFPCTNIIALTQHFLGEYDDKSGKWLVSKGVLRLGD